MITAHVCDHNKSKISNQPAELVISGTENSF